jgi:uncharacterized protein involved in exopolysaccharide biosynthesis
VFDEGLIRKDIPTPSPTLRDIAMVLFRQRRVFLCAAGIIIFASLYYLLAGARYQAHMKILVRPGRADAPVSAEENAPLDLTRLAITEEELNSEVELLRDDEVLRTVVAQTGASGRDWFHVIRMGETPEERVEREARTLAKKLKVEPLKKTNLILVRYSSDDPRRAAKVLRSVADAYLQKHTLVHRPGGEVGFFEQQTEQSRRELEEAKRRLLEFTTAHDIIAAAQQRDLALQKLSDMDANYRQTRVDISETQQRILELQAQLAALPERSTTQVRTADNPELLKALKANLLDLELKRTQLLTKFEPNHRLVQEVDQEIMQAHTAIAAEAESPLRDQTTDKNTHYEWAKSELERARVQLMALQARAAATASQEAAYRSLAKQFGDDAITQDDLEKTEKAAEDNYLLYVKKQEEARMADALDRHGIANVAIAEEPVAPVLPAWSNLSVLLIGFAGAGISGIGAAFLADYLDPALRTPDEVFACLNLPVLASLPCDTPRRQMA